MLELLEAPGPYGVPQHWPSAVGCPDTLQAKPMKQTKQLRGYYTLLMILTHKLGIPLPVWHSVPDLASLKQFFLALVVTSQIRSARPPGPLGSQDVASTGAGSRTSRSRSRRRDSGHSGDGICRNCLSIGSSHAVLPCEIASKYMSPFFLCSLEGPGARMGSMG